MTRWLFTRRSCDGQARPDTPRRVWALQYHAHADRLMSHRICDVPCINFLPILLIQPVQPTMLPIQLRTRPRMKHTSPTLSADQIGRMTAPALLLKKSGSFSFNFSGLVADNVHRVTAKRPFISDIRAIP